MFALPCPGMRRSCSSLTSYPSKCLARRAQARTSPLPPRCQAFVVWGSSITRASSTPTPPSFSRACCSRRCRRRSYSRSALAPARPSTTGASPRSQPRHVTVRETRSQTASSPAASSWPHTTQRSDRRRQSRFFEADALTADTSADPCPQSSLPLLTCPRPLKRMDLRPRDSPARGPEQERASCLAWRARRGRFGSCVLSVRRVDYEQHGITYGRHRRGDPRIGARIDAALGDARSVLNVGAGTGSYEPADRWVLAVEPSATMRAQRPPGAAPAIAARAEALPFDDDAVDAVMACVTVHHWEPPQAGLREMRRVARGPVVVFTFDLD